MIPGFGAGLVIPDLWQQEAVRALQTGKDPPPPRLWRDKRGGAGADRLGQDLHLRAALSEPENSGGVHRPHPRSDNGQRFRATPSRVNALHPNLARSPIMHHKRAYDQFANDTPATTARRTDAFKSMASVSIHRKPLTMNQNLLSEL